MANKQAQGRKGSAAPGRQLGTPNKRTTMRQFAAEAAKLGETPLQHMLRVMNNRKEDPDRRLLAARSAAPYCHPQLRSIDFQGSMTIGISKALQDFITGNATATRSFLGFDDEDRQPQEAADGRPLLDH